jgi:hypothetical protein
VKINLVIDQLKENLQPYSMLLPYWVKNEDCSLNEDDLYIIEVHTKNNFKLNLFESFMFYNQCKHIERINAKLRWDSKKFKQWAILNFLFSIVELANNNGGQNYLHQPIGSLNLKQELKECLFKLNVFSMIQIFEKYKEKDLEKEKIFDIIIEFESLNKQAFNINSSK